MRRLTLAATAAFAMTSSVALAAGQAENPCVAGTQGCVLPTAQTHTTVEPAPATTAYVAPIVDDTPSFSGFRIEGLVGYDRLSAGDGGEDTEDGGDNSIDGILFGVGAGFDFDMGGLVAGIEGEYTESTAEQDVNDTIDDIDFNQRVEIGRDIYVGGRLGFKATPSTLIYGKAGYTNTSIEAAFEGEFDDEAGNDLFEFDTNIDGWRLGAGIEQLFGPNMYGKLEYRYSNYGNLDFDDDFDFDDLEGEDNQVDIDLNRHQVVLGLGLRF